MDREQLAQSLPALKEEVVKLLEEQNEGGVWPFIGDRTGGIGEHIWLVDYNPQKLLALLERSEVIAGKLSRPIWIFPNSGMPNAFGLPTLSRENWMDLSGR